MGDNRNEQRKHETPNKRERAKAARGRRKGAEAQLAWGEFAWQEFAIVTVALAKEGGAVRLGATRDGGAWALGIYHDGDYATEYIKPNEDCVEALWEIAEAWLGADWLKKTTEAKKEVFGT